MKSAVLLAAFLVMEMTGVSAASASEKFIPGPENKMVAKGILSVSVPWIKDKGEKFDVNLSLHNESDKMGIVVFLSDIGCARGARSGELKHTFFNTGEKTIDFRPGETKSFTLVCRYGEKVGGDFKLSVSKVYDNPSLDGKTVGKVIAKGMSWSQSDRRE